MDRLKAILSDPENSVRLAAAIEREPAHLPDGYVSPLVGDPSAIQWYRARKALSFYAWDIYAAAAIKHYRAQNPSRGAPLVNARSACVGTLPTQFIDSLESEYLRSKEVPWRDERPEGYSFDPFNNPQSLPGYRDECMTHHEMSSDMGALLSAILTAIAPEMEAVLGHYWSAGAVRLFSQKPGHDGGFHTDGWPLAVRKLMIYPSGADAEKGTTTLVLRDGSTVNITGGKGTWALFENSTLVHRATAPLPGNNPRPTIEISVMPAFRTDPTITVHGIHVGYPWLPPDVKGLEGDAIPNGFTSEEINARSLLRTLMLAIDLPDEIKATAPYLRGLGYLDA
ncbi:MAG TPA: hypothetical protein VEH07_08050 [Alphaproteobacteria bacterium]|nr:hypothetical protein [Alphaproteobacteria bacterium]